MYVKQGKGENVIDFETYEVKPNTIFFISPGQIHSIKMSTDTAGYVFSFEADFYLLNDSLQKLLDYPFFHSINNLPVCYLPSSNKEIESLCVEMFKEFKNNEKDKNKMLRAMLEVFLIKASRLYDQKGKEDKPINLTYQLRKLESLIEANFKTLKSVKDYANLMHVSSKHLNSLCKRGLGKTVTNLVHQRILIEARRLLLFTDNTITEIAYELGFSDKSYFIRFFKKNMFVTPDVYRANNKKSLY